MPDQSTREVPQHRIARSSLVQEMHCTFAAIALTIAFSFAATNALGVEPNEVLKNPQLEERARAISVNLRCLVCQNQSIDDSDAGLARDLRILVRERLAAGDSDKQVLDFVVARYGEFVLLKPVFAPHTYLLWLAPVFILALAAGLARSAFLYAGQAAPGRREATTTDNVTALSKEEEDRLERLFAQTPSPDQQEQAQGAENTVKDAHESRQNPRNLTNS